MLLIGYDLRLSSTDTDLSLVVDLDLDLDLAGDGAEAAELSLLVVVVAGVKLRVLVRQLHGRDQQVVLKSEMEGNEDIVTDSFLTMTTITL